MDSSNVNFLTNPQMMLVKKLREASSQLFVEICMMHLSRAMDLAGDSFANLFTHLAHKDTKWKKDKSYEKKGVMNGAPLTQEGICTIYQLIEYISEDFNVTQENIFRKAGNHTRQFQLRLLLNNATPIDLNSKVFNVHDCCCVLKNFLSDMKEPLLTASLFKAHLKVADESEQCHIQKRLMAVQILFLLLPVENYILLQNLLTLLQKVAQNQGNHMDAESLAIIFSPLILCPREISPQELQPLIPKAIPAIKFIIENAQKLFRMPKDLVIDLEKHLRAIESGTMEPNGPVQSSVAFCQRHPLNHSYTTKQVESLLLDVQNMPNCPQKKLFLKRYKGQNRQLTPATPTKDRKSRHSRSYSVGESLKKVLSKSVKKKKLSLECRASSCERLQAGLTRAMERASYKPVSLKPN